MRRSSWCGFAFVVVAIFGCAPRRSAPVAKTPAPIASAFPSSSAPPAPRPAPVPSAPSAKGDGCGLDPLRSERLECGEPIENPAGLPQLGVRRDGSCKTQCQKPPPLPLCKNLVARPVDATSLKSTDNVRLRGALGVPSVHCTKRGGPCACNNQCSGSLRLARAGASFWNAAELGPSVALLQSDQQELECRGDDASVCCPYAMDPDTRTLEVIASGKLVPSSNAVEARLVVSELCRVPVPLSPPEPAAAWSGGELVDLSEGDRPRLGVRAGHIWDELISAVPQRPAPELRFVRDGDAFAVRLASWCTNDNPIVAASDGLLLLVASLAQATAYDRVFKKNAVDTLSAVMAHRLDRGEGLADLDPQELPRTRDPRVLARQHEFFDSTLRFLFAHELAHFVLGHNPCSPEARAVQARHREGCIAPAFSLPLEIQADEHATRLLHNSLPNASPFRPQAAIAWFRFLAQWERLGPSGIRTDFQRASVPPQLRAQIIYELTRGPP